MSDKILNPLTGRMVNKSGVIGKKILNGLIIPLKKEDKSISPQNDKVSTNKHEPKRIDINTLKKKWSELFQNQSKIGQMTISQHPKNLLQISLNETDKKIGLIGPGMFILRKMKDIAMCNKEDESIYIPKNFNKESYQIPLWNLKHGYMYTKNDTNIKNLMKFVYIINNINDKYKDFIVSNEMNKRN